MIRYILIISLLTLSARAELAFVGFFTTSSEAMFSLRDTNENKSSGWIAIGQSFSGYKILKFWPDQQRLDLERGTTKLSLKLQSSKAGADPIIIKGSVTLPSETLQKVQGTLIPGEESAFPLKPGVILFITASEVTGGVIQYSSYITSRQPDGKIALIQIPIVTQLPGKPFSVRVGDVGFQFTP